MGFGGKPPILVKQTNISDLFTTALNFHQQKQFDSALNTYDQILAIDPSHLDTLSNLGSILKNLGRCDEAINYYQRVLQVKPEQIETWFNLGNALHIDGKLEAAEVAFRKAIAIKPDFGLAHFKLAKVLQEQQKFISAVDHYQKAIDLVPNLVEAYTNLGNTLKALGQLEQAIALHRQALQIQPSYAEAHYNLGNTLFAQKEYDLAIACLHEALRLKPDFVQAHIRLGLLHQERDNIPAAEIHLRQALQFQPNESQAFDALIFVLHKQRKSEQAIALLQEQLQKNPDDSHAHSHLGTIYNDLGRYTEAIAHLRKSLKLNDSQAMTFNNLGFALVQEGQLTEAIANFQSAINLNSDLAAAYLNLGHALTNQGRVTEGIACFKETLRIEPDYHPGHSNYLYALNYDGDNGAESIASAHKIWGKQIVKLTNHTNWQNILQTERKLRIGYLSPDFRQHSVAYFIESVLTHHDPEKVHIVCYANVLQPDAVTARLKTLAHDWHDIYPMSDLQVAELIEGDRIDILVDLAGHTGSNRLPVFALKPAPIQITYLGYPNTSGLSTIDYRFSDRYADPQGMTDDHYTEKLIRLPHCFLCYQPPSHAPDVINLPAQTLKQITFGSFNNLPKLTPQVIALWSKVLHAVPNSRIILKINWFDDAGTRDRYWQLFNHNGIDSKRVKLIGLIADPIDHLAFYGNIDIALDPFPYHGTTTTCEALWMGVPVITLAGKTHVSRVGVSLLNAIGLPELIATNSDEYIALAVRLASNLENLAQLRAELRNRMTNSYLCNRLAHTQNIETAYREVWQRYCSKC